MIHSIYIYKSEFMDIIIYGSLHGSTKRYAERLEEMTGIAAINYKDVKEIAKYDRIIYLGALYASGVMGLKKIVGRMSQNQKLIVATVGLADPENPVNITNIRNALKEQIPPHLYDETKIFHLRGGIDYSRLGLKHKVMMSLLCSKVSKMPEEELDEEQKTMLATYGGIVDFVDLDTLKPLAEVI
jgi:menaquinone-dependent protoporphyrinogen IX oxidase